MNEVSNGRIKLTWQQVTYLVGIFVLLSGQWFDMRTGQQSLKEGILLLKDAVKALQGNMATNSRSIGRLEDRVGVENQSTRNQIEDVGEEAGTDLAQIMAKMRRLERQVDSLQGKIRR